MEVERGVSVDGKGFFVVELSEIGGKERRRATKEEKTRKSAAGESKGKGRRGKKALQSQHFGSSRVIYAFNTRPRHPASHSGVRSEKIY